MSNKPLQYVLKMRKLKVKGKENKEEMQVAMPTGRKRVDFRSFCKQVANNTTFSPQEVYAVLNQAIAAARDIVANGDSVEFGDMGTLKPSFKSTAVAKDEKFNAKKHIIKPVVRLLLSKKYFELNDASFEQVEDKKKGKGGIGQHGN